MNTWLKKIANTICDWYSKTMDEPLKEFEQVRVKPSPKKFSVWSNNTSSMFSIWEKV